MIEDDPAFDPDMPLPQFDLESMIVSQINTQKTSSQMSPPTTQMSGSQSPGGGFQIQLNFDHSSILGGHDSPFGLEGLSSARKMDDEPLIFTQEDDVFGTQGDWGIEIDEEGNVIEPGVPIAVNGEPELPPLPPREAENALELDDQPLFDDQGDVIMQEAPLPDAEPFPEREEHEAFQNDEPTVQPAPSRRKKTLKIDNETQLSRNTIRRWQDDYLENCGAIHNGFVKPSQAKRNAMLLTFGLGIGNIGQNIGVPGVFHPLAIHYSGDSLFTTITGIEVKETRGRRRTSSEAMLGEAQDEGRRVRPRLMEEEEGQEQAREGNNDEFPYIDDTFAEGPDPEVGREGEHPMSDHLSSTLQPWNRGSSAVPGSSVRGPNSVQKGRDLSSPLGKHDKLQEIVRYSDDAVEGRLGSDGWVAGGIGSADSSFDGNPGTSPDREGDQPATNLTPEQIKAQAEQLFAKLDAEVRNFLGFVRESITENGERREDEDFDLDRKWLGFDDLFVPRTTKRSTAAQAFYHTLCLVTRGEMFVQQDDATDEAFGPIWLGAKIRGVLSGER